MKYYIPTPPTVNKMWSNNYNGRGRGRYRSKGYNSWIDEASLWLKDQNCLKVPFSNIYLEIFVSRPSSRSDIDNRIKAIPDLLQKCSLIDNDVLIDKITIEWLPKNCKSYIIISEYISSKTT